MEKWVILIMAVFSVIDLSMACSGVEVLRVGQLSCKDKKTIVAKHNELRNKIATGKQPGQSSAKDMLQMTWDDELEKGAQNWAKNCKFEHDSNDARRVSRFYVGQNLGITYNFPTPPRNKDQPDFSTIIQSWYDEVKDYRGHFTPQVGHFTQVVWAETYLIGCGYIYYKQSGNKYTKLYVCNYGPGGNIMGQDPYVKGSNGCNSTLKKSPKFPGLCKIKKFKKLNC